MPLVNTEIAKFCPPIVHNSSRDNLFVLVTTLFAFVLTKAFAIRENSRLRWPRLVNARSKNGGIC